MFSQVRDKVFYEYDRPKFSMTDDPRTRGCSQTWTATVNFCPKGQSSTENDTALSTSSYTGRLGRDHSEFFAKNRVSGKYCEIQSNTKTESLSEWMFAVSFA